MAALVDDILDLSEIEADAMPLMRDRIDLNRDVVKIVLEIVEPFSKRKGLSLSAQLDPLLPVVVADPVRLRQVLLNLLNNAIRYTEHGGVTVRSCLSASRSGPR